jgi:hypothetical protein
MMQPSCDGLSYVDPPVLPSVEIPWYGNPAIWFWIGVLVALGAMEFWAWRQHRQTPSQWLRKQAGKFRWLQVFGTGLFAFLIWHFFYSH